MDFQSIRFYSVFGKHSCDLLFSFHDDCCKCIASLSIFQLANSALLQVPLNSFDFIALFVYMMCIVGELFLLCYYGTVVYEEVCS